MIKKDDSRKFRYLKGDSSCKRRKTFETIQHKVMINQILYNFKRSIKDVTQYLIIFTQQTKDL